MIGISGLYTRFMVGSYDTSAFYMACLLALGVGASGLNSGAMALLRHRRGLRALTAIWLLALLMKISITWITVIRVGPIAAVGVGVAIYLLAAATSAVVAVRQGARASDMVAKAC